jgi:hypothetical protein
MPDEQIFLASIKAGAGPIAKEEDVSATAAEDAVAVGVHLE